MAKYTLWYTVGERGPADFVCRVFSSRDGGELKQITAGSCYTAKSAHELGLSLGALNLLHEITGQVDMIEYAKQVEQRITRIEALIAQRKDDELYGEMAGGLTAIKSIVSGCIGLALLGMLDNTEVLFQVEVMLDGLQQSYGIGC